MKLNGNSSTAELKEKFGKLVSPSNATLQVSKWAKSRKQAKKTKTAVQRRAKTRAALFAQTARAITYASGRLPDAPENAAFLSDRLAKLLNGDLDLDYWQSVSAASRSYYGCVPTNIPDPTPPPYAYRQPDNLPSKVTYPLGTPLAAPLEYQGATLAGYFRDDWYKWTDVQFSLPEYAEDPDTYPIVMYVSASFDVTADKRGSRPMFSLVYKVDYLDAEIDTDEDPRPPTTKPISLLYRYKPPLGLPPYYHATLTRTTYLVLPNRDQLTGRRVVRVRLGVRPMFGRANNNNTTVSITCTCSPRIYIAKRSLITSRRPAFRVDDTTVRILNNNNATFQTVTLTGMTNPIAAAGTQILAFTPLGKFAWKDITNNRETAQPDGLSLIYVGPTDYGVMTRTNGAFVSCNAYTGQFLIREYSPACIQAVDPHFSMGGGFNQVLTTDGWLTNQTCSPPRVPVFTKSESPPIMWGLKFYIQDVFGQWWQFDYIAGAPGDVCNWQTQTPWSPTMKLGPPTQRSPNAWASTLGIMIPMAGQPPGHYHLLTWQGWLHDAAINDIDATTHIGYLT